MQSLEERFWSKVDKSGGLDACWEWQGWRRSDGYGECKKNGKRHIRAHRVAWEFINGPIPDGLNVLHKCDNPPCCNPAHLFLGTHFDNMADMTQKGRRACGDQNGARLYPERMPRGERNGTAKLTRQQVLDIRANYHSGQATGEQLAERHGVSKSLISGIVNHKRWTWL